jgi:hypothetical protein
MRRILSPFKTVAKPGEVWEQLGAERARREMAEDRVRDLEAALEVLRAPRESPTEGTEQTKPETSKAPRGVLLPPRDDDAYSPRRWPVMVLPAYVIGCLLCCGAAVFNTFLFENPSFVRATSPILSAVSWHVVAVLLFGLYAGLRDGTSKAVKFVRDLFVVAGLVTATGVTLAIILVSIWANDAPIEVLWSFTIRNTIVRSSNFIGMCVLFYFAVQLGKALQLSAGVPMPGGRWREMEKVLWPAVFPAIATIISALIAATAS